MDRIKWLDSNNPEGLDWVPGVLYVGKGNGIYGSSWDILDGRALDRYRGK